MLRVSRFRGANLHVSRFQGNIQTCTGVRITSAVAKSPRSARLGPQISSQKALGERSRLQSSTIVRSGHHHATSHSERLIVRVPSLVESLRRQTLTLANQACPP